MEFPRRISIGFIYEMAALKASSIKKVHGDSWRRVKGNGERLTMGQVNIGNKSYKGALC
jgi:hypothetical protein